MKALRKALAVLFAVIVGLGVGARAAQAATGSITVNAPAGASEGSTRTYKLYQVLVAVGNGTSIRYNTPNSNDSKAGVTVKGWTLPDVEAKYNELYGSGSFDQTTVNHFIFDTTGSVHWGTVKSGAQSTTIEGATTYDAADINDATESDGLPNYAVSAIADYVANDTPIAEATATGSGSAVFTDVDNGYYYITTTAGSAVSVTTSNPNATITDKNNTPTLSKKITQVSKTDGVPTTTTGSIDASGENAIAELGSTVTYQVTVNFGKGSTNVKLHDTLTGLTLAGTPQVSLTNSAGDTVASANATGLYTVRVDDADSGDSLTIDFSDGIDNTAVLATVTYTATVTNDALTRDPATNSAKVSYGSNNTTTGTVTTNVYNAKYTVTKTDTSGTALAGAGFVLRKAAPATEGTQNYYYYKYDSTNKTVSWVLVSEDANTTYETAARNAAEAGTITRYTTTDDSNVVTFAGLADGTYELYELDVPDGYMRAANVTFTIHNASTENALTTSNLEQTANVVNRTGSELPGTGSFGTTAFYAVGACLLAGAAALVVVRKRMTAK